MGTLIYIMCGVFGVLGRLFAQAVSGRRELANRRTEFRFHALVDAWRILDGAAAHNVSDDALDRALADVRLFGAARLVQLATRPAGSIVHGGNDERAINELRHALRAELRTEMRLARSASEAATETWRRVTPNQSEVELHPAQLVALRPRLHLVRRADLR
jgi:hypothetical protein